MRGAAGFSALPTADGAAIGFEVEPILEDDLDEEVLLRTTAAEEGPILV